MSNDPNAPYFELSYARSLSRRLQRPTAPVVERPVERPTFTRFVKPRPASTSPAFDAAAIGQSLRDVRDAWGASAWHALLDGCTSAAAGSGAFAMDAQGLVIAARGELDEATAARLGGRLMLTLEHAEKMGEQTGVVCIEVDGRWLTGLRAKSRGADEITIGLLAMDPIGREARSVITELLATIGA